MPTDERITFFLDVPDELAAIDFVAHLQGAEVKQELIADLAKLVLIVGVHDRIPNYLDFQARSL